MYVGICVCIPTHDYYFNLCTILEYTYTKTQHKNGAYALSHSRVKYFITIRDEQYTYIYIQFFYTVHTRKSYTHDT